MKVYSFLQCHCKKKIISNISDEAWTQSAGNAQTFVALLQAKQLENSQRMRQLQLKHTPALLKTGEKKASHSYISFMYENAQRNF